MIHRKGNEHSQGHRDTGTPTQGRHPYRLLPLATTDTGDRLALARSYPYRRIPTQEGHRQEDRNTQGRHPRPCCSLLLARSPSRSMMIHHKGNEHSQEYRETDRLTPLQALTIGDHRHRRQARSRSVLSLQENTDTGGQDTDTGDRLAPVGSLSLSVYDDTPQRK